MAAPAAEAASQTVGSCPFGSSGACCNRVGRGSQCPGSFAHRYVAGKPRLSITAPPSVLPQSRIWPHRDAETLWSARRRRHPAIPRCRRDKLSSCAAECAGRPVLGEEFLHHGSTALTARTTARHLGGSSPRSGRRQLVQLTGERPAACRRRRHRIGRDREIGEGPARHRRVWSAYAGSSSSTIPVQVCTTASGQRAPP